MLSRLSGLPTDVNRKLRVVFDLLTAESLDQAVVGPFLGPSRINADGLPFQWVLRTSNSGTGFGFLCEVGKPEESPDRRFTLSRTRLASACEVCGHRNDWLDTVTDVLIPPLGEAWPAHWLSALWIGVVPLLQGILLKPYFNLNAGSARDRWLRAGRVLLALGRERSLASLCDLSGRVSQDSWPVGLTVDVLPNGHPGRVKIYFRSDSVTLGWLRRWYESTGHNENAGLARRFIELFPLMQQKYFPKAAFTVGLEFHPEYTTLGLKTDLAVTKWIASDATILGASKALADEIGGCVDRLETHLDVVGAIPADTTHTSSFRFVGLGHEPDRRSHLNLYLEPRTRPPRHSGRIRQHGAIPKAIRAAVRFLIDSRRGDRWVDYELPVGASDAWVTAYTLARLATVRRDLLPKHGPVKISQALDWLMSVHSAGGGWGYSLTVPNDADSTAWAILALRRHNRPVPHAARDFLLLCRDSEGCFSTYPPSKSPLHLWSASAPDVTATAMYALQERWNLAAESRFSRCWAVDGNLPAYWWISRFYTLALLLEGSPEVISSPFVSSAINWLERAVAPNAFDTALLLLSLVLSDRPRATVVASELCRQQCNDGSWPSSAVLRLTSPEIEKPWSVIASQRLFRDQNSIFTTSTAVAALSLFLLKPIRTRCKPQSSRSAQRTRAGFPQLK
jgi:hypothetical protein